MAHSVRIKREKERLHARGVHHNLIQIQLIKLSPDNIKTIPSNMCIVHFVDCKKTHRACLCVCAVYTVHLRYIYIERESRNHFHNLENIQLLSAYKLLYGTFHMNYIDTR